MATKLQLAAVDRTDLLHAIQFAREQYASWQQQRILSASEAESLEKYYNEQIKNLEGGQPSGPWTLKPAMICWDCKQNIGPAQEYCPACGAPLQDANVARMRYLAFTWHEVRNHARAGRLPLADAHGIMADLNGQIVALRKTLDQERVLLVEPIVLSKQEALVEVLTQAEPATPAEPSRPLLEILLDPRSIQWLLAIGGVLLVLGLVIYLAASGFFENRLSMAIVLGVGNLLLLSGGWAMVLRTRYQLTGRALTLLACLAMPLNLWFYHSQGLLTLEQGGLWIPALLLCGLYAGSAWVLKDPAFVYALVGGIVLTGLLILTDHHPERFWQITVPSTMLVILGMVCIHIERLFPVAAGPFSRQRFGLAFFWSGQLTLAAGLLLLLAAQLTGGPFYESLFKAWYAKVWDGQRPDVAVTPQGKLMALMLVLLGTYAYVYSDLVVRKIGLYLTLAVATLLWAEVLLISLREWPLDTVEMAILTLALTGLLVNLGIRYLPDNHQRATQGAASLGLLLSVVPVLLGIYLYFRAVPGILPPPYRLDWSYVAVMAVAALSCRIAAYWKRGEGWVETVYLFGTAAALLVGLVGVLMAVNPRLEWYQRAPVLMLLPIAYLLAARMSRGQSRESPLNAAAHTAAVVLLLSGLYTAFQGFVEIREQPLNLFLALFFAEAALFYALEATFRREGVLDIEGVGVYGTAVMGAAAVWQVLAYLGVSTEVYILGFAALGLLLLLCYRFMVLEKLQLSKLAAGAFWAGNALLLLGSTAGALRTLVTLVADNFNAKLALGQTLLLPSVLAVFSLLALVLVRETSWRRIYVVSTILQTGLAVLAVAVLSNLTYWEKCEIVVVVLGLVLLVAGHIGLFREKGRHDDLTSFTLILGCLLAGIPLTNATLYCRLYWGQLDLFHTLNELGMLVLGLLLLASGTMLRVKATTMTGAVLVGLWLITLVLYARLPERLQTTAIYLMIGGAVFFGCGLLLSVYRDRLLTLPERIKRREGVFRVLSWR